MKKYMALFKANFFEMLYVVGGGNKGKKKISGIAILILMAFVALYISVAYSLLLGQSLAHTDMLWLLPMLMAISGCLVSLFFTVFAASGMVYGGRDMDLMFSLPLSPFSIMISKLIALYIENLLFIGFMIIPAGGIYLALGGDGGIFFMIRLFISIFFLALIPTLLAMIIGFFLAFFQSKLKRKALLSNLMYLVFFAGIMYFSFRINILASTIMSYGDNINSVLHTWLYPFGLLKQGLEGNLISLLMFMLITLLPFLAVVYLFSKKYKSILTKLTSHHVSSNYKLGEMKSGGQFMSLFKKEAGRFFQTPIYLFNTGIGIPLAIGFSIFGCFKRDMLLSFFNQTQIEILPILMLALGFISITICPACVSISLEGKTFWILKEAPISAQRILLSKGLFNAILIWGTYLICIPMIYYIFNLALTQVLLIALVGFSMGILIPAFGLLVNLKFPKLDGTNDVIIVKQSTSAFIGVFGGMAIIAAGFGAYALLTNLGDIAFLIIGIACLVISICICAYINKNAEKKILEL